MLAGLAGLAGLAAVLAGCAPPPPPSGAGRTAPHGMQTGAGARTGGGGRAAAPRRADIYAGFRFGATRAAGDRVRLAVWYPTRARPGLGHLDGPFLLRVAKDAPAAPGRFGLIVISHGSRGGYLNHRATARALARAGYVVVAVHYPGITWDSPGRLGRRISFERMPAQFVAAIDWALADKRLGPRIDRRRIGAIGYSSGAYAVLSALGADADLRRATDHCVRYNRDPRFCVFEHYREDEEGRLTAATGRLPGRRDPRIRAAALWAPIGVVFEPTTLRRITARLRIYRAEKDGILRRPWHATEIGKLLTAWRMPHEFVVVRGAGHFAFLTPFPLSTRLFVGEAGRDPPGFDRAAFMRRLNAETVAFFGRALPGRTD